jgi:BirA family biotin operon repressor/biotin-[acetyl-CoA-carboxylase] ligase
MSFEKSAQQASRLESVASTGSTNTDLIAAATANSVDWPDFSVLVTAEQTAGRGRSGREWLAPAGSSLFVSVLLRPRSVAASQFSWLPLIAGLSMANAISGFAGSARALVKWPNDVLIGDKKVCGVLSELLPDLSGVVVGAGVNVFQNAEQLPVDTASSLAIEGIAVESLDELLAAFLKSLKRNYDEFVALAGELGGSELHAAINAACGSVGCDVRVVLPGDQEFLGRAIEVDSLGRLVVQNQSETRAVSVGDIVHLRHN